jgi:hypothetical protein
MSESIRFFILFHAMSQLPSFAHSAPLYPKKYLGLRCRLERTSVIAMQPPTKGDCAF